MSLCLADPTPAANPHAGAGALTRAAVAVLHLFSLWRERAQGRRALLALDDRALHDIGIDRMTAVREATTPFWRASP